MQTLREMNDQIMGPTGSIPFGIISAPIPVSRFARVSGLRV